jgi:hypothetical protein
MAPDSPPSAITAEAPMRSMRRQMLQGYDRDHFDAAARSLPYIGPISGARRGHYGTHSPIKTRAISPAEGLMSKY